MIDCRKFVNSPITVLGQPAKVFARTRTSVGLQPQRTHRSILNQFSCLQGFIRFPGTLLLTIEKKKKRRQMDSVVDFPQLIYPNSVINTVSYLTDQCEKGKSQITSIQLKTTNQPIIAQEAKVSPLYKFPCTPSLRTAPERWLSHLSPQIFGAVMEEPWDFTRSPFFGEMC